MLVVMLTKQLLRRIVRGPQPRSVSTKSRQDFLCLLASLLLASMSLRMSRASHQQVDQHDCRQGRTNQRLAAGTLQQNVDQQSLQVRRLRVTISGGATKRSFNDSTTTTLDEVWAVKLVESEVVRELVESHGLAD
eukprot:TRINITY_DN64757_c0_g1_i1.p2 TRINITY_DN64757_c0_g1~~TRINITY_DN64757_c0_g1_i1.p2  ORF type:complete len:135 (-),score=19.95 TRINITY_DN64757_c0_g1_i1:324-728(-)